MGPPSTREFRFAESLRMKLLALSRVFVLSDPVADSGVGSAHVEGLLR